jgi:hypothetical protein
VFVVDLEPGNDVLGRHDVQDKVVQVVGMHLGVDDAGVGRVDKVN